MESEEFIKEREEVFKLSMKFKRNILLDETDKYLLSDYPITPENLEIVKIYRQALRDITNNNYILPDKPEFIITLN
jgi:predicted ATP-dependent Lon-type protease